MVAFKDRFSRLSAIAEGVSFATGTLNKTGVLSALSPSGVWSFARAARGTKPGPHSATMLHAANKPEKIALIEGKRRIRYGDMDRQINQLAHGLAALGVHGGDCVALMMPNCLEYVIAQQALARIGATAVQIGYRLKGPEVAYILDNAEPRAVIVHASHAAAMNQARATAGGPPESHVVVVRAAPGATMHGIRYEELLVQHAGDRPPASTGGAGVIVYTSGTTGRPKGAARDMRKTGLEAVADFMAKVGMRHDDIHLVVCPLYHSAAPAFAAMMFTLGATLVIEEHFDAEAVLATIARERITSAFMVPTMLVRLASVPNAVRAKYDTGSLRWIVSGAAPLPTETARRFQDRYGHLLWNFYGSTETGLVTLAGPEDHVERPGTVGQLLRGNEVRLLDEQGCEVAPGEVGELYARNSMLISGYHKNQEATDKSIRDGFFSVGDLAHRDADGYVYLASRKHDMVISGGVNIYPREIEDHLHTHPEILEAAVIGVPHEEWGESLKAFVVRRAGSTLGAQAVIDYCRDALADYKRPRAVEFLTELPHNPTGKVLKRELRDREAPP
ncbi:MAG TPA: AMP-binding protein [Kofleriaceae bacterium]|nr:AMP-binding protein [Kofleriaceae bacterium]